jgi:hypothetical protein
MSERTGIDPPVCPHCGATVGLRYRPNGDRDDGKYGALPMYYFTLGPELPDGDRRVCNLCGLNEAGYGQEWDGAMRPSRFPWWGRKNYAKDKRAKAPKPVTDPDDLNVILNLLKECRDET